MIPRVVNVRDYGRLSTTPFIYVGRPNPYWGFAGHQLANPFRPVRRLPAGALTCLQRYEAWLDAHPNRDTLLARLAEQVLKTGLPLACWCGNYPEDENLMCHAVILAKRIAPLLEV